LQEKVLKEAFRNRYKTIEAVFCKKKTQWNEALNIELIDKNIQKTHIYIYKINDNEFC
jgi:hypothetical protein